jgi:hypothetical protein
MSAAEERAKAKSVHAEERLASNRNQDRDCASNGTNK